MKKEAKVLIIVFSLMLIIPLVLTVISITKNPGELFSEWEQRNLATFPKPSAKTVFSGEWGLGFESFLTDRFCFRDEFTKLKRSLDSLLLIKESGGVYVTSTSLFDIPDTPSVEYIDNGISSINALIKNNPVPTTLMLVPSKVSLYNDGLPLSNERELIEDVYKRVEADTINLYDVFENAVMSDIFYDTDHHWTNYGAHLAYNAWRGTDEKYDGVVIAQEFLGTLSSRSADTTIPPDTMEKSPSGDVFECEVFDGIQTHSYPSMYFDSYLSKKDKYSYFLGTNQPIVTLTNKEVKNGQTLLIFKDSFAHSFVQYAVDFEKVVLVDMRHAGPHVLSKLEALAPDHILFLQSFETFSAQNNLVLLNKINLF